jgi:hypothetical protein
MEKEKNPAMSLKQSLNNKLDAVKAYAGAGKLSRMLQDPTKYLSAQYFAKVQYPKNKESRRVLAYPFFGGEIQIALPSGMDLFLSGGKTHDSEIRLCRYLINELNAADTFCDVGAHVGFFSLLAKQLIDESGKVMAIEASPITYELLQINCKDKGIETLQLALSEQAGQIDFYVFPALYSEYNAVDISQYKGKDWFEANLPTKYEIKAETLDHLLQQIKGKCFIKIDVEGHEAEVLKGAESLLHRSDVIFIVEMLAVESKNYLLVHEMMLQKGFKAYLIQADGSLTVLEHPLQYMQAHGLDSENIVYQRS